MKMRSFIPVFAILVNVCSLQSAASGCPQQGTWLQVLGSGGPELSDQRASSAYLVWIDGKAKVLLDMGAGSLLRFEQAGARVNDLDVILMSHFHVDHSNDLPALIKASYFSNRQRDLPLYGPTGNQLMPSATAYVQALFGEQGAYRYLQSYIDGTDTYRLLSHDVPATGRAVARTKTGLPFRISSIPVHHGPIPSLGWRVDIGQQSIVFSGDMNNDYVTLTTLAKQADILVAHHAIPEDAGRVARNLHMIPSVIGQIAANAGVKQLVLSHRMQRTIGREQETRSLIQRRYQGTIQFAEDLRCYKP